MGKAQRHLDDHQKSVLKQWFSNDPYPTRDEIRDIATELGLSIKRVYNWFSQQRFTHKK